MMKNSPDNLSYLLIIMGVSGCGKSTLAQRLAAQLGYEYIEADDFHSTQAKSQMALGTPLTDELRLPWITRLCDELKARSQRNHHCVLACSCLKQKHRELFHQLPFQIKVFFLEADQVLIRNRLHNRTDHFVSDRLLDSQFDDLQRPQLEANTYTLDANKNIDEVLNSALNIVAKTGMNS